MCKDELQKPPPPIPSSSTQLLELVKKKRRNKCSHCIHHVSSSACPSAMSQTRCVEMFISATSVRVSRQPSGTDGLVARVTASVRILLLLSQSSAITFLSPCCSSIFFPRSFHSTTKSIFNFRENFSIDRQLYDNPPPPSRHTMTRSHTIRNTDTWQ